MAHRDTAFHFFTGTSTVLHGNQAVERLFDARPVLLHSYAADRGAVRGKKTASRRTFPLCSTTRPLRAGK